MLRSNSGLLIRLSIIGDCIICCIIAGFPIICSCILDMSGPPKADIPAKGLAVTAGVVPNGDAPNGDVPNDDGLAGVGCAWEADTEGKVETSDDPDVFANPFTR